MGENAGVYEAMAAVGANGDLVSSGSIAMGCVRAIANCDCCEDTVNKGTTLLRSTNSPLDRRMGRSEGGESRGEKWSRTVGASIQVHLPRTQPSLGAN